MEMYDVCSDLFLCACGEKAFGTGRAHGRGEGQKGQEMRIISGKHRGRVLAEFRGKDIRPTADRVKESLFNILSARIPGARVLDLFCGSGSVGLEALSRGADYVVFNDASRESLAVLQKNLDLLRVKAKVYNMDFRALLESIDITFDIIFLDPPYKSDAGEQALEIIARRGLLNTGGVAVLESDRPFEGSAHGLVRYDERKYGITYLTFFSPD